jgi:eukaryotic-like serine/threonine-protein kinase
MDPRTCPFCGGELKPGLVGGLCPRCVLKQTLPADSAPSLPAEGEIGDIPNPAQPALSTAGSFGDYEMLGEIARGGMGIVYKARQRSLNRIVALKVMLPGQFAQPEVVQRFQTEAEVVANLQHPNIVAIHEIGVHHGQHYFSMDYVEGRTLAEVVREHPLPPKRAAAYLKTIAEAVHYAHQHGILHRDLKPSNVLIDSAGQPRITDFGLAKRLTVDSDMTLTGQVLGSPNFMAPEQAEGRLEAIGPASEVYALGAMLYHLLTRQPPFQANTLSTLLKQLIEVEPVPPRLLNPSIPRDLETICLKCLEKEIPRRYATAQALADDLGRYLGSQPVVARPASFAGKAWRWCERQPVRATLAGALLIVFVVGLTGVLWAWRQARQNAEAERQQRQIASRAAYVANIGLAQSMIKEGRFDRALEILLATPEEYRSWEWGCGMVSFRTHRCGLEAIKQPRFYSVLQTAGVMQPGFRHNPGRRIENSPVVSTPEPTVQSGN